MPSYTGRVGHPSLTSRVLDLVTASYHLSRDFNGIRYTDVLLRFRLADAAMLHAVRTLVKRGAPAISSSADSLRRRRWSSCWWSAARS